MAQSHSEARGRTACRARKPRRLTHIWMSQEATALQDEALADSLIETYLSPLDDRRTVAYGPQDAARSLSAGTQRLLGPHPRSRSPQHRPPPAQRDRGAAGLPAARAPSRDRGRAAHRGAAKYHDTAGTGSWYRLTTRGTPHDRVYERETSVAAEYGSDAILRTPPCRGPPPRAVGSELACSSTTLACAEMRQVSHLALQNATHWCSAGRPELFGCAQISRASARVASSKRKTRMSALQSGSVARSLWRRR